VGELAGDVVRDRPSRLIAEAAREAFGAILADASGLAVGAPEAVSTPGGEPSYWLVPGLRGEDVVAVARIFPDARVATVGELRQPAVDAAQAVTGLGAEQARQVASDLRAGGDATVSEPVLVHDGPVGREAWLSTITTADGRERWVFATGGGTYEREANTPLA
jgi:hypothetical protein